MSKRSIDRGFALAHAEVVAELEARIAELEADEQATGALITRQQALLRGVVDAIRGPHPDPLTRWGVHDAPELAAALVAERDHWKMYAQELRKAKK